MLQKNEQAMLKHQKINTNNGLSDICQAEATREGLPKEKLRKQECVSNMKCPLAAHSVNPFF